MVSVCCTVRMRRYSINVWVTEKERKEGKRERKTEREKGKEKEHLFFF